MLSLRAERRKVFGEWYILKNGCPVCNAGQSAWMSDFDERPAVLR